MGDYIPKPDSQYDSWYLNFKQNFATLASGLGFAVTDVTIVNNGYTNWNAAYTANITAQNAAKGAAQTKVNQKATTEAVIRSYVTRIQSNPACTDQMRAQLGITIKDKSRSPSPPPTEAPNMELDWSKRGRVTVHVGNVPSNELINKFPAPAKTTLLQYRQAGETDWQFLAVVSASPFVHVVGNSVPETLEYRSAYLNSKGQQGPWSEAESAYVASAA